MKYIPRATYRVQLNEQFDFNQLQQILPYLADLGISDIYASPIFKARTGSKHGYDVVDPMQLNPELGTESEFEDLITNVQNLNMGWVQDIVPNHMAFDSQNNMLMDVLERGPDSKYANFFDVDWDPQYVSLEGKILAPFLGSFYAQCLEDGEIQLNFSENGFSVSYYDHQYPIRIGSYANILTHNSEKLKEFLGAQHPDYIKLLGVMYVLKNPVADVQPADRADQVLFVKRMLWELYQESEAFRKFLYNNLAAFNGEKGNPESFDLLDKLLYEQFYRLAFWKVGTEEINYRRFFYVNDLISLHMQNDEVFSETHTLIQQLLQQKKFNGLRIDHVDGLYDPTKYLKNLERLDDEHYVIVEKIQDFSEELPEAWSIQGTSGYDFMNYVNGIFCKRENEYLFDKIYRRFSENQAYLENYIHDKKQLITEKHMAGDIDNLARILVQVASRYRYGNDFTLFGLRKSLTEVLCWFPVYRTYVSPEKVSESDVNYITAAVRRAKVSLPDFQNEIDFICKMLVLDFDDNLTSEEQEQWLHFVRRFQQMSGPLMAKGFEDTVLYSYNRFLSLNDVGGDPGKFGVSDIEFHYFNKNRASEWPHTMNATSTHDTKRGEDVRARLNVLSEIPDEWQQNIKLWSRINRPKRKKVQGIQAPDRNDEYFLYQTLIGTFPFSESEHADYVERIKNYVIKAVREAKTHTAWLKPDTDYEDAFLRFVDRVLSRSKKNNFMKEFMPFQRKIAFYGMLNSLSQTVLKITAPGLPDFYQGTELWDLNLVDPDNRRPVDYNVRKKHLNKIKQQDERDARKLIEELWATKEDARIKLFLIYKALQARKNNQAIFQNGNYVPLEVGGIHRDHVIAFARFWQDEWAIVVAPHFFTALVKEDQLPLGQDVWHDTFIKMPEDISEWKNEITNQQVKGGKEVLVGEALEHFAVAILTGDVRRET